MDAEEDLVLATKKDQADLLTAVLKASDDDADEEVIQPSVSTKSPPLWLVSLAWPIPLSAYVEMGVVAETSLA